MSKQFMQLKTCVVPDSKPKSKDSLLKKCRKESLSFELKGITHRHPSLFSEAISVLPVKNLMELSHPAHPRLKDQAFLTHVSWWKQVIDQQGQWLYFPQEGRFSLDSFKAFLHALRVKEEEVTEQGQMYRYVLALSHLRLTSQHMELLSQFIAKTRYLSVLDLCHNPLDQTALEGLAKSLSTQLTIEVVKLKGCRVGVQGSVMLAKALKGHLSLKTIELSLTEESTIASCEE